MSELKSINNLPFFFRKTGNKEIIGLERHNHYKLGPAKLGSYPVAWTRSFETCIQTRVATHYSTAVLAERTFRN